MLHTHFLVAEAFYCCVCIPYVSGPLLQGVWPNRCAVAAAVYMSYVLEWSIRMTWDVKIVMAAGDPVYREGESGKKIVWCGLSGERRLRMLITHRSAVVVKMQCRCSPVQPEGSQHDVLMLAEASQ